MKIISTEKFTVNSGDEKEIRFNGGQPGDTSVAETYIQTLDDIPFTVTGIVKENEDGVAMKVVDIANFEKLDSVTTAGLYMILSGSLQSANISFSGSGNVIVKKIF